LGYVSQARGRLIILCFAISSLVLAAFPGIDLFVSGLFYSGHFPFSGTQLQRVIRDGTTCFLCVSLSIFVIAYAYNKLLRRDLWGIDGRKVCYVVLVLALGAGLIVNLGFKDQFGRARPRDVTEFGGDRKFTAAFAVSTECRKNCSFSSGEAAAGFFSIAIVYALGRRRRAVAAAVAFGALVSLARIASGAHFLSDTVVSFFIMWLLADCLRYYLRLAQPAVQRKLDEPDQRRARQVVRDEVSPPCFLADRERDPDADGNAQGPQRQARVSVPPYKVEAHQRESR
jgi:lipid A 4'-phosphatase